MLPTPKLLMTDHPMTDQHPMLPTQEQFTEWDSEYFDGERQNFDIMMIKAFQAGADKRLEQVIEWIRNYPWVGSDCPIYDFEDEQDRSLLIADLKKAMRPQEES